MGATLFLTPGRDGRVPVPAAAAGFGFGFDVRHPAVGLLIADAGPTVQLLEAGRGLLNLPFLPARVLLPVDRAARKPVFEHLLLIALVRPPRPELDAHPVGQSLDVSAVPPHTRARVEIDQPICVAPANCDIGGDG